MSSKKFVFRKSNQKNFQVEMFGILNLKTLFLHFVQVPKIVYCIQAGNLLKTLYFDFCCILRNNNCTASKLALNFLNTWQKQVFINCHGLLLLPQKYCSLEFIITNRQRARNLSNRVDNYYELLQFNLIYYTFMGAFKIRRKCSYNYKINSLISKDFCLQKGMEKVNMFLLDKVNVSEWYSS